MSDNITIKNPSTSVDGSVVASDDIGGVQYQRVKVAIGADGSATDCSSSNPMPIAGVGTAGSPGTAVLTVQGIANGTTVPVSDGGSTISVDDGSSTLSVDDGGSSLTVDGTGNFNVVGVGSAGSPSGGVLSVQGVSSGQALTVTGTITAVTAITNALPAGTNAIGKLSANSGVDIGDVTINNASSAPVYIAAADGVNLNTSSVTVATCALPSGAATEATLSDIETDVDTFLLAVGTDAGSIPTRAYAVGGTDGTNFQMLSCNSSGHLNVVVSSAVVTNAGTFATQDSQVLADNAGFTDGTSKVWPAGFIYDESAGTALTENDAAAGRIDAKRALVSVIEDETTRGRRATVTASNALKVDGSGVAQPVTDNSGSLTVDDGGTTLSVDDGGSSLTVDYGSGTFIVAGGGTAGSAGSAVLTVQGIASMTPIQVGDNNSTLSVDDGGGAITVDGTVTVTQGTAAAASGFWYVRHTDGTNSMPAGDAVGRGIFTKLTDGTDTAGITGSSALLVDLSATTANATPIVIAGAGTAGSSGTAVLTIQGIANGTTVPVADGGGSLTVDGSGNFSANLAQIAGSTIEVAATGIAKVGLCDGSGTEVNVGQAAAAASLPVVIASDQWGANTTGSSGALGSLDAVVSVALAGQKTVGLRMAAGTLAGTIVPELSFDGGSNYIASSTYFRNPATGVVSTSVVLTNPNSVFGWEIGTAGGATHARVRVSVYTSGTVTCYLTATQAMPGAAATTGATGAAIPPFAQMVGGSDGTNLRNLLVNSSGYITSICTGAAADGATLSGNPVLVAGSDGTNAQSLTTSTGGYLYVISTGAAADGAALSGNPVLVAGSDGTNAQSLTTDSSGRQLVVGAAADGAAAAGNPVLVAGQDGTNAQSLLTDSSGRLTVIGAAADGAAVAGNPVLIAGTDGTNAQTLSVTTGGILQTSPSAHTTGGMSASHTVSAASTNATNVKNAAGQVYAIYACNINAAVRYLKLYNTASAPTVGTDTPVAVFAIPGATTGGNVSLTFPVGLTFGTGISFALTTGLANSDTGAVSASEHTVFIGYK